MFILPNIYFTEFYSTHRKVEHKKDFWEDIVELYHASVQQI